MTSRHPSPLKLSLGFLAALAMAGCSSAPDTVTTIATSDAGAAEAGRLAASANTGCSSTEPGQGCGCEQPGQTVACWTGPQQDRGVGACHDGTRHCVSHGEFLAWGPCGGQQLQCGSSILPRGAPDAGGRGTVIGSGSGVSIGEGDGDATTGSGSGSGNTTSDGTCSPPDLQSCAPGTTRWCDDGSCYWGKQTCGATGTWGECQDTPGNAGPSSCASGGINYDENCCEQGGECCAHAVNGTNYGSVGSCAASTPCLCTQLCAAGAVRWCSVPTDPGSFGLLDMGDWGQQSCLANGTWGTCATVSTHPAGCGSGPRASSPSQFDAACCASSGECCETFDTEDADPGSIHCPATACDSQWQAAGVPSTSTAFP